MSNKIITLVRGDTLHLKLPITNICGEQYTFEDGDAIYFGLTDPHQLFENALVKKKYTFKDVNEEGNIVITLNSCDTVDLFPGVYYYSIKLKKKAATEDEYEEVITVANKTKLILND